MLSLYFCLTGKFCLPCCFGLALKLCLAGKFRLPLQLCLTLRLFSLLSLYFCLAGKLCLALKFCLPGRFCLALQFFSLLSLYFCLARKFCLSLQFDLAGKFCLSFCFFSFESFELCLLCGFSLALELHLALHLRPSFGFGPPQVFCFSLFFLPAPDLFLPLTGYLCLAADLFLLALLFKARFFCSSPEFSLSFAVLIRLQLFLVLGLSGNELILIELGCVNGLADKRSRKIFQSYLFVVIFLMFFCRLIGSLLFFLLRASSPKTVALWFGFFAVVKAAEICLSGSSHCLEFLSSCLAVPAGFVLFLLHLLYGVVEDIYVEHIVFCHCRCFRLFFLEVRHGCGKILGVLGTVKDHFLQLGVCLFLLAFSQESGYDKTVFPHLHFAVLLSFLAALLFLIRTVCAYSFSFGIRIAESSEKGGLLRRLGYFLGASLNGLEPFVLPVEKLLEFLVA